MGTFKVCPTCGNTGEEYSYVWRCNECGRIYCDKCYGPSGCPGCGTSYLNATQIGTIG